jgi:hypothetical protein
MIASPPVATVTATFPVPAVSFGMIMLALIPPVAGSVAVVDAVVDGEMDLVFDCAAGEGSDAGVDVAVGAVDGLACGSGDPPPPPHAASTAMAANAAMPARKRYLCMDASPDEE